MSEDAAGSDPADRELAAIRARLMKDLAQRAAAASPAPAGGASAPSTEPAWPESPVDVTDATFLATVQRYRVSVVDCWAPWCGPCRLVAPIVEQLAKEMRGRVAFLKLNTDENPRTAQAFGIQSIPTLLVFRDGNLVDRLVGAMPKPQIAAALRPHLERRAGPGPRRV